MIILQLPGVFMPEGNPAGIFTLDQVTGISGCKQPENENYPKTSLLAIYPLMKPHSPKRNFGFLWQG